MVAFSLTVSVFQCLLQSMEEEKVKGFAEVLVAQDVSEGIGALIQTSGLGGLTHNTGT